jgi:hypothetical protein
MPSIRLREKLARPGGVTRQDAVMRARKSLEHRRPFALEGIEAALRAIAYVLDGNRAELNDNEQSRILFQAGEVFNLACLFQLHALAGAAAMLCDLVACGSPDRSLRGSIAVFLNSLKFLAGRDADQDAAPAILAELKRLVGHVNRPILSNIR